MRVLIFLLLLLPVPSAVAAVCTFNSGTTAAIASISLPSTLSIPRDAANDTPLWDSGWRGFADVKFQCTGSGAVHGELAAGIGASVPGYTSVGFPSVFETNVPGIGVSVFWCNTLTADCNPDRTKITPPPSLNVNWSVGPSQRTMRTNWRVILVKTAHIGVNPGTLTIAGQSRVSYIDLGVTTLSLTGNSQILGLGCEINSNNLNIDVPLPTVQVSDFNDASPVPIGSARARAFSIGLLCDSGVKVNYQVDGPQSGDANNVLANASGTGMATGVGVQLFEGDVNSTTVLQLGSKKLQSTTTQGNTPVNIPLTAKYYRTAADVASITPGLVSTTAVFTLTYE